MITAPRRTSVSTGPEQEFQRACLISAAALPGDQSGRHTERQSPLTVGDTAAQGCRRSVGDQSGRHTERQSPLTVGDTAAQGCRRSARGPVRPSHRTAVAADRRRHCGPGLPPLCPGTSPAVTQNGSRR